MFKVKYKFVKVVSRLSDVNDTTQETDLIDFGDCTCDKMLIDYTITLILTFFY